LTRERWAQIRQVFEDALGRPAKDRVAYLHLVCAGDGELRREVESLLKSHDDSTDFLSTPAAQLGQAMFARGGFSRGDSFRGEEAGDYPKGYRVGPYEFERRIGRGGMGSVWLASRFDHEYKRQVAIKMVRRGTDSQEILRRFRMERQVLAGLDHPNIARLIDGGSTPDGLPFLVMEYVEGTRIDQYCETRKVPITGRLQLFRAVCSAVQYAHQNLVVHRDIKAGNILVTAGGVPKLLDFGIAKLLRSDSSTMDVSQTRPDMRPMTLDYASPEQVRGEPITTATDVYSLGVLLYKLLTGKMPYGGEVRTQAALLNAITDKDPLKPSTVILMDEKTAVPDATQKLEAISETRDSARKRLRKKLAGDLDGIILKALRKQPNQRYVSAEQFSADIQRYLDGRPVIARSDTPGYRLAKFLGRNGKAVAAAFVVGAALISIAWLSGHYASVAKRAQADVERSLKETRHQLVAVYARTGQVQQSFDVAKAAYAANPGDPEARRDFGLAANSLGDQLLARGDHAAARERYTAALAHLDAVAQANRGDFTVQLDVVGAANDLAALQVQSGDLLAALSSYSRALQAAETWLALARTSPAARQAVAEANRHVGEVLIRNGAREAGMAKLRKALEIYQQLSAGQPDSAAANQSVAELRQELAQ
jgi:eukaryotic-like serine/threonine-protein kinase